MRHCRIASAAACCLIRGDFIHRNLPAPLELVFRNMRRSLAGDPLVDAARPEPGY
jgi:hypothetical protein